MRQGDPVVEITAHNPSFLQFTPNIQQFTPFRFQNLAFCSKFESSKAQKMKRILILIALTIISLNNLVSQTTINGSIKTTKGEAIIGANIFVDGTFDGCSSDLDGNFTMQTSKEGEGIIKVSYLGFLPLEETVQLNGTILTLELTMKENVSELETVTITAGAFEASDEKKAVVLNSIDIVTTAGAAGDIYGALKALPGTQTIGESGQLFVRGGDSYESKTYIDGMQVLKPFSSSTQDVPSRGRFSPFLFKGTLFATGAYSAEYGQGLSSALILETQELAEKDITGISLMAIGASLSHTERLKNTSVSAEVAYTNLKPLFSLINQNTEWIKAPNGIDVNMSFRQKTSKTGMLKVMANYSQNQFGLNSYSFGEMNSVNLKNKYGSIITSYKDVLNDKWSVKAGYTYANNDDEIDLDYATVDQKEELNQVRLAFSNYMSNKVTLNFGVESARNTFGEIYEESINKIESDFTNYTSAAFVESNLIFNKNIVARVGLRAEHSSLINRFNIAPRISTAFKTGKDGQFSLAYGQFYQNPERDFLKLSDEFTFERASHYIANYQVTKNKRTFRGEVYWKEYKGLVKYDPANLYNPEFYNNNGTGHSRGIDVFFRDRKSIKYGDYWISYSYLDSKRDYRDFPKEATPGFAPAHSFSFVYKHFVPILGCQFGATYSLGSGRSYTDPNRGGFNDQKTKVYQDLSMNVSYLTNLFGNFTVVYASVGNVPGFKNVFNYRFNNQPNEMGIYEKEAVIPTSKRFFFVGVFVSIGKENSN